MISERMPEPIIYRPHDQKNRLDLPELTYETREESIALTFTPGALHQGHEGILHGGVIADAIDYAEPAALGAQGIVVDGLFKTQCISYDIPGKIGVPTSCTAHALLSDSGVVTINTTVAQDNTMIATATTAYTQDVPVYEPMCPPQSGPQKTTDIRDIAKEKGFESLAKHITSATGTYGNYRLQRESFQYDSQRKSLDLWYPLSQLPDRRSEPQEGVINFMIDLASGALGQIVAGPGNIAITANHTIYRPPVAVNPDKDIIFTTRHVESSPPTRRGITIETEVWQGEQCIAHAVTTLSRMRAPARNRGQKGGESLPTE